MPFDADLSVNAGVAKIVLSGELDASNAPIFQKKVEEAAAQSPKRLALVIGPPKLHQTLLSMLKG